MNKTETITLHGGPCNKRVVPDYGFDVALLPIITNPKNGVKKLGSAVYEPDKERTHAFWLENQWEGAQQSYRDHD